MQTIGERIRFIRLQENVTMAKMASELRTYHANLSMIENGTKEPSVELIIKVHRLFPRYSIYWILYGVEEDENMNGLTGKDASSLVKQIEKYLNRLNIRAEIEEANIFGFDINMENTMMSVRIICDTHEKRVMIFGEAPFNIPQNQTGEVLKLLNHIHQHEYNTAHCFINMENGHLMSQVVLNIDSSNSMDYDVFRYGLCDVCYIIDNYYKEVMKILVPTDPGKIAIGIPKKNKISW